MRKTNVSGFFLFIFLYSLLRLVDDVASHVRLFKKARLLLRTRNKGDVSDNGKIADLESMFFDAEVTMEGNSVCRDLVCTIHQEEIEYLQVRI